MAMTKRFKKLPKAAKRAAFAAMDETKTIGPSKNRAKMPIDVMVSNHIINTNLSGFKKIKSSDRGAAIKKMEKISSEFSKIDKSLGGDDYKLKIRGLNRVVNRAKKIK